MMERGVLLLEAEYWLKHEDVQRAKGIDTAKKLSQIIDKGNVFVLSYLTKHLFCAAVVNEYFFFFQYLIYFYFHCLSVAVAKCVAAEREGDATET